MPLVFLAFTLWSILSIPFLPLIINYFLDTNNTDFRLMIEKIMPKYFMNQEDYFYFIVIYGVIAIFIGGTTLVATGMMLIAYLKHACGIFKVAR